MNDATQEPFRAGGAPTLRPWVAALLAAGSVGSFHLAFMVTPLSWLVLVYLGCLFTLRRLATARQAFYVGLAIGVGVFVPQMGFLWTIFRAAAIPLWLILALFHAAFLLLLNRVEFRLGTKWAVILAPVLWCGIEYFRSEVWWLRFSWFGAGSVFVSSLLSLVVWLGVYASGCISMALAGVTIAAWNSARRRLHLTLLTVAALVVVWWFLPLLMASHLRQTTLRIAGLQLEFPAVPDVLIGLDKLAKAHPNAELLMLSEYTFADGPPPESVKAWCRRNGKWLVVGGKTPAGGQVGEGAGEKTGLHSPAPLLPFSPASNKERFYNTAFVISTNGEIVFTQAKSRPIQFFADGEPAPTQRVWDSPWGKLGIAICYDASYRQVTDELIRQGAVALLIPTMDVEAWGEYQHRVNARMARLRAAEYRVPIFRVASSGISQIIGRNGREIATAPFPGQGEMIAGELRWSAKGGTVPLDAWLAPACTGVTGGVILWLGALAWRERRMRR